MPAWLADLLALDLSSMQVYALFFLLGSFTVAALSDVKHLSAQREFVEVWGIFTAVLLLVHLWDLEWSPDVAFWVKWGLLTLVCVASIDRVGWLFRLAPGDVFAMAAAMSLLSPVLIVVFVVALKLASWPVMKLTARGNAYPFLPVITVGTMGILGLGFWLA